VVAVRNRFDSPFANGYRDINLTLKDKKTGHLSEVQVQVKAIQNAKGPQHVNYEMAGNLDKDNPKASADVKKKVKDVLNAHAKQDYDDALDESVGTPLNGPPTIH
jgi:hypothetical protein